MPSARGKDKFQRKKRGGLNDKQREEFKKKLKATADAKASKKRKQNEAKIRAAKHSLIGKMLGSTANSGAAGEASIANEAKLKSPEDEQDVDVGNLNNTDTASVDDDDDEDGKDKESDNTACLFEEEAPAEIETVSIYPTLDIDDNDEDYVDVPDDEPVIQDADDNAGNGSKKWGNEPQVGVQQRYVWRCQTCPTKCSTRINS